MSRAANPALATTVIRHLVSREWWAQRSLRGGGCGRVGSGLCLYGPLSVCQLELMCLYLSHSTKGPLSHPAALEKNEADAVLAEPRRTWMIQGVPPQSPLPILPAPSGLGKNTVMRDRAK